MGKLTIIHLYHTLRHTSSESRPSLDGRWMLHTHHFDAIAPEWATPDESRTAISQALNVGAVMKHGRGPIIYSTYIHRDADAIRAGVTVKEAMA